MTLLATLFSMIAFAGVYALIATMLGDHRQRLVMALAGPLAIGHDAPIRRRALPPHAA
jgi:hypothetical protein